MARKIWLIQFEIVTVIKATAKCVSMFVEMKTESAIISHMIFVFQTILGFLYQSNASFRFSWSVWNNLMTEEDFSFWFAFSAISVKKFFSYFILKLKRDKSLESSSMW